MNPFLSNICVIFPGCAFPCDQCTDSTTTACTSCHHHSTTLVTAGTCTGEIVIQYNPLYSKVFRSFYNSILLKQIEEKLIYSLESAQIVIQYNPLYSKVHRLLYSTTCFTRKCPGCYTMLPARVFLWFLLLIFLFLKYNLQRKCFYSLDLFWTQPRLVNHFIWPLWKFDLHGTIVFAQGCVSLPLFYEIIFGHELWCTCHIFDNWK